jgi:hypothetical protein
MSHDTKQASSQAAWALLVEGVASARVEAHRLRHIVQRAEKLVKRLSKEDREEFFRQAGDMVLSVPKHLEKLEDQLDWTSYALALMGKDFLESRLPLSERTMVDEALESANPLMIRNLTASQKVALRYLLSVSRIPSEQSGVKTVVVDTSKKNLPPNTNKPTENQEQPFVRPSAPEHKERALPITPNPKPERDRTKIPPGQYTKPGPAGDGTPITMRTPGEKGEEYGHPSVGPRITPKRRTDVI